MNAWTPASLVVDASAGYGKTEKLCARLAALFLTDPGAARGTVAMTFTRAAAGEIYVRLLTMLGDALGDESGLAGFREKLGTLVAPGVFDDVPRGKLLELLERLISDMGALNISTIDSFFYRLVADYSIELGLPGKVEMGADNAEKTDSEMLARELFGDSEADEELISACGDSRYGDEAKSCFDSCLELLQDALKFRDRRRDEAFWGKAFGSFRAADPDALRAALRACDDNDWPDPDRYRDHLRPMLEACAEAGSAEYHFTRAAKEALRAFLAVRRDFPRSKPKGFSQGYAYPEALVPELLKLVDNGGRVLLCQCARRTMALRKLLDGYFELYGRRMLMRGRLNFADLPHLLAENAGGEDEEFLNEIRYRTNCRFRHFLIDEFQDTSRIQWRVLDPIVRDNGDLSQPHSLFVVGDVKQAIYGWREGDSELMADVAADHRLVPDSLPESFRYGADICGALNHIFGVSVPEQLLRLSTACVHKGVVPPEVYLKMLSRWKKIFHEHVPNRDKTSPGEFEVLALAPGAEYDFTEAAAQLVIHRLHELDFFANRMSGGVLVRDRKHGIELRDKLLELDASLAGKIVWEGDESIIENTLVASLIAFGVLLQYPGDAVSAGIAEMDQLMRDILPADAEERRRWSAVIAEYGIAGFLRAALGKLNARSISWGERPARSWTPVRNGDVDTLLALAERFDASGEAPDMLRFRTVVAAARRPADAIEGKLRLLTIHHSKGLTFDAVFVPMFDPARGGNWRLPELSGMVAYPDRKAPEWVLRQPREEGMTDPAVREAVLTAHGDRCFEELCALYVAFTRAKRGVYVYLPPRNGDKCRAYHPDWKKDKDPAEAEKDSAADGKKSRPPKRKPLAEVNSTYYISDLVFESCFADDGRFPVAAPLPEEPERNGVRFIRRHFGGCWRSKRDDRSRPAPLQVDFGRAESRRLPRVAPSQLEEDRQLHFVLPSPDSGDMLGTRIHAFFARIGRWRDFAAEADADPALLRHYDACARNPEIVELLDAKCELWRERAFDVVLERNGKRELVSGCFDRVQLYRGVDGSCESAVIIDYKSNRTSPEGIPELCEHYRRQLEDYRAALAVLTKLHPERIACRLIFTSVGIVAAV